MTFAEYNTDENFKNDNSSLKELVNIGKKEGMSFETIKKALSPSWQKSKQINNIGAYYYKPEGKKEEPKKTDTTTPVIAKNTTAETKPAVNLKPGDKKYMDQVDNIAQATEDKELDRIINNSDRNWNELSNTLEKQGQAFGVIDDKMVGQLPTFMLKRYSDGEFGDPRTSGAKLRLAHFMINNLGTALSNVGHVINKDGVQEQSDWDKYQQTNLAQGLENRWNKYKQETDAAVALAGNEGIKEQDARLAVQNLTRNTAMNTKWNMMNEKQKLFALEVTKEIGDYLGDMDLGEISNLIAGSALTGNVSKDEVVAIGIAKLAAKSPDIINNMPEGQMKNLVLSIMNMSPSNGAVTNPLSGVGASIANSGEGSSVNNVVNSLTGNTYQGEDTRGSAISGVLGLGNMNDKNMSMYYELMNKTPEGIETALPDKETIIQTMKDYPDAKPNTIANKAGIQKAVNKQFSEIDKLAKQATKDFKKNGDVEAYQSRMTELNDYKNELKKVYKKFGYIPLPGNDIQSDYDKAFSKDEEKFRSKYAQ